MENVNEMGSWNKSSNIRDDDSFIVDIQQVSSPHSDKDVNPNSRITLQKCLSRKGMQRGSAEKNSGFTHTPVASPRATATLHGASMPEKPMVVMVGAIDQSNPQLHNSITIMTGGGGAVVAESMVGTFRKFSFRRLPSWIVNPRRILFFFATISSMGTILLIYFTLSINKLNGDA